MRSVHSEYEPVFYSSSRDLKSILSAISSGPLLCLSLYHGLQFCGFTTHPPACHMTKARCFGHSSVMRYDDPSHCDAWCGPSVATLIEVRAISSWAAVEQSVNQMQTSKPAFRAPLQPFCSRLWNPLKTPFYRFSVVEARNTVAAPTFCKRHTLGK